MPLCNWKKCDAAIFSNEVGATKSINTERGIALIAIPQKQTLRNMKKKKGEKIDFVLILPFLTILRSETCLETIVLFLAHNVKYKIQVAKMQI